MAVKSYRELIAWQKAINLVQAVYRATATFPKEEIYGLRSQVRRSAISTASNMAEGQGRKSTREFLNFLSIARGSLCEMEPQVILAERLGYFDASICSELLNLAAEVGRLINGLSRSLSSKSTH